MGEIIGYNNSEEKRKNLWWTLSMLKSNLSFYKERSFTDMVRVDKEAYKVLLKDYINNN